MQHAAAAGSIRTSSYNVPGCLLYVPRYVAICRALRAAAARRRRYRLRACTAHACAGQQRVGCVRSSHSLRQPAVGCDSDDRGVCVGADSFSTLARKGSHANLCRRARGEPS
jgi:hypothetical protein